MKKTGTRVSERDNSGVPTPAMRPAGPVASGAQFDDPWLRAAMFAPSLLTSFTTTTYGDVDYSGLLSKPGSTIVMTFSNDPSNGLAYERFDGGAIVFPTTVTFKRTAALRM